MVRDLLRFSILMLLACTAQAYLPAFLHAQRSGKSGGNVTAEGKQIFVSTCAACHGLDGGGGEHAPDISHRQEVQRRSDKALLQIVRQGVPGTGMPAFGSLTLAQAQAVVHYLRTLQGRTAGAELTGDPKRGRALFFGKAECSQCHMAKGEGGFIASDLSGFGGAQSAADIRSTITDPNRTLDPRKRTVVVTTSDGQSLTGVPRNEDNFSLQLQTTDGALHLFAKSELQTIEYQPRSLMPDDYKSRLTSQELDNLVGYLVSIARNKSKPKAELQ